jgi:hypothetical protein
VVESDYPIVPASVRVVRGGVGVAGGRVRPVSRIGYRTCGVPWDNFSVSKSVTYPTRLETRTKESSICASHWAVNPKAQ